MVLNIGEIIAILTLIILVVGAWINVRVKIKEIETTMNIKIVQLEARIADQNRSNQTWVKDMKEMITQFLADNKEEHRSISHDVKNIRQSINAVCIKIAELKAIQRVKEYEDESGN